MSRRFPKRCDVALPRIATTCGTSSPRLPMRLWNTLYRNSVGVCYVSTHVSVGANPRNMGGRHWPPFSFLMEGECDVQDVLGCFVTFLFGLCRAADDVCGYTLGGTPSWPRYPGETGIHYHPAGSDMETIEVFISADGQGRCFYNKQMAMALPHATRSRLSHVEPVNRVLRWLFYFVRNRVNSDGLVAAWTRRWPCHWQVRILGGPQFGPFSDRHHAIHVERSWICEHFFMKGINHVGT